jgi:Clathrin adaptor complex small chain
MINAVLVFNNSGQPRLTKFYTQIVSASLVSNLFGLSLFAAVVPRNTRISSLTHKPSLLRIPRHSRG